MLNAWQVAPFFSSYFDVFAVATITGAGAESDGLELQGRDAYQQPSLGGEKRKSRNLREPLTIFARCHRRCFQPTARLWLTRIGK